MCQERIESILTRYQKDFDPAVAESCVVALDAADYWGHDNADADADADAIPEDEGENNYVDGYAVNVAVNPEDKSTTTGGSFGKQKHSSTVVANCEIRKQILAQHFNIVQTA